MANFKLTYIFNFQRFGWSETWYTIASSHELAQDIATQCLIKRAALVSFQTTIEAIRISDEAIRGDSLFYPVSGVMPRVLLEADTPWNALLVRANATPLYRRAQWLRGIPDDWIKFDANSQPILDPTANARFLQWEDFIKGRLALKAFTKIPDDAYLKIVGISADPDGFIVLEAPGLVVLQNDTVTVRSFVGPDKGVLNGRHTARANGNGSVTISVLFATLVDPNLDTKGLVAKRTFTYPFVTSCQLLRFSSHRAGRAFFVPAGRRRSRR